MCSINGWAFAKPDPLTGVRYIHELYSQADPLFTGRATVPVLWDKETHTIVNNESADIIRMFNHEFDDITQEFTDYYPDALAAEIDQINDRVYRDCQQRRVPGRLCDEPVGVRNRRSAAIRIAGLAGGSAAAAPVSAGRSADGSRLAAVSDAGAI